MCVRYPWWMEGTERMANFKLHFYLFSLIEFPDHKEHGYSHLVISATSNLHFAYLKQYNCVYHRLCHYEELIAKVSF